MQEKLEPLGIEVKQVIDDSELPFEDSTFDMIINILKDIYIVLNTDLL